MGICNGIVAFYTLWRPAQLGGLVVIWISIPFPLQNYTPACEALLQHSHLLQFLFAYSLSQLLTGFFFFFDDR